MAMKSLGRGYFIDDEKIGVFYQGKTTVEDPHRQAKKRGRPRKPIQIPVSVKLADYDPKAFEEQMLRELRQNNKVLGDMIMMNPCPPLVQRQPEKRSWRMGNGPEPIGAEIDRELS